MTQALAQSGETLNSMQWFPYIKGGPFRKWYGNNDYVIDWKDDGRTLRKLRHHTDELGLSTINLEYYF